MNAIYVWGLARAAGGRVLLRIEDHDRQRCRPEYEAALLDDLDWLGLQPDVFATSAFRAGPCEGRQSDRHGYYLRAAQSLIARGLVFGCDCSRRQIEHARSSVIGAGGSASGEPRELVYSGRCRARGVRLDAPVSWRLLVEPGALEFDDVIHGVTRHEPAAQCGDLLLRDRLGNWTYQFAAAVDDLAMGVDLVIRGDDLLASTGRQILLAWLLGRRHPPVFLHHALVMKSATQKLSKSDGDTGLRDLRAAGWTAPRVLGRAAFLAGLVATEGDVVARDLPTLVCR